MGGDPGAAPISDFARSLHDRWQLDSDIVKARRIEDQAACLAIGAAYEHWPIPDCIYRTYPQDGKPLYPSEESIFGDIHTFEAALVSNLSERLAQLPAHDRLIIPLGVGHHVDHQLTRLAAETGLAANRLTFYEDYPYSMDETAVKRSLMTPDRWHSHIVALSEHDLEAKIQAIGCYHSQLGTFFDNLKDLTDQVGKYSNSIGGERLWSTNMRLYDVDVTKIALES